MKVNLKSSKGLESVLSVVVTKKEIQDKINIKLDEVKDTINLKGFRPGKAPRELLKKQFGKALYGEVMEKTLNETTYQALKDKKIKPAGQPKIDVKSSGEDKDLEFTIEVEKFPKIKKVILNKIEIEKYKVEVDKKDLETRLDQLAENSKKYKDKDKDEPAKINDLVIFNYEATVDGKNFDGNKGDNLQIVLGKDLFIKNFDKQIIGLKKNQEKLVKVQLPDNYPKKELAGKYAEFKCKIINIQLAEKQKIDDKLAKNFGAKDLKDLKSIIENQISKEYESVTNQLVNKNILDQLDKQYKLDLPKRMVEDEKKAVEHTFVHEKMNESKEKDHSKIKLQEKDKIEIEKISQRRVKLALILSHIGEEHSVKVSSQELQSELEKQLRMYPGQERKIREHYKKNPAELIKLRGPLFEEKVMNLIKEKAKVITKSLTKDQLEKLLRPEKSKPGKAKIKTSSKSKIKKSSKK